MFTIPEDLTVFSVAGLEDLRRVAQNELTSLRTSIADPESVTDEQLERGEALRAFITSADTEIDKRNERKSRFAALEETQPVAAVEPVVEAAVEPVVEAAAVEAPPAATATPVTTPDIAAVAQHTTGNPVAAVEDTPQSTFGEHRIVAGADIPDLPSGTELNSWKSVAEAFIQKTRAYGGKSTIGRQSVATIYREYTDPQLIIGEHDSDEVIHTKLSYATDEKRLPGNSLVAANGWCAPSETLYSTCLQVTTDGLLNIPEVTARRGGIRHNQGIEFDTIFGTGAGFNILTEAQVIADTAKTCVEIPCPPFVDDRLKVAVLCLTGAILQNRAYPEFVADFVRGAIAVQAHNVNRQVIADIVAGSGVAIDIAPTADPVDNTAGSGFLAALEIAAMDIRYRLRLAKGATLEAIFPYWAIAQARADLSRRTGVAEMAVTDEMINSWMALRGIRAQWVYDYLDAFSGVAANPGSDTPITQLPFEVTVPIYPAGTWVLARQDVIRIDSLYDSVLLPQNLVTQLFMEDGFAAMRMCPLSRLYTLPLCPSGETSAAVARTCTP
jgi:hypothetical protein